MKKLPKRPYFSKAFKKDDITEINRYISELHEYMVELDKSFRRLVMDETNSKMTVQDKIYVESTKKVSRKEFEEYAEKINGKLNRLKDED